MCKGRKENRVTSNTMPQLHVGDTLTDVMVALACDLPSSLRVPFVPAHTRSGYTSRSE